jgi:hypothetical protein
VKLRLGHRADIATKVVLPSSMARARLVPPAEA